MEKPNNPEQPLSLELDYTNPDGKKDLIRLNLEQKLAEFIDFYKNNEIDTSEDFEDKIKEIWNQNRDDIKKEIQEHGFDEMLLIPSTPSLDQLKDKTIMEKGYYQGSAFDWQKGAKSFNTDKIRLILTYGAKELSNHPETKKTLNTQGKDVPLDKALTLEDYLIFQKKYYEQTGKHLDEEGGSWVATSWSWLRTSDELLFRAGWDSRSGRLSVSTLFPYNAQEHLAHKGFRPSRNFYEK